VLVLLEEFSPFLVLLMRVNSIQESDSDGKTFALRKAAQFAWVFVACGACTCFLRLFSFVKKPLPEEILRVLGASLWGAGVGLQYLVGFLSIRGRGRGSISEQ